MSFKKDDKVTFVIEDIGTGGEGIGKVDGYTLFVKDAIIGDKIEAKIIKAKKNYGYARLEKIIEASSDRVTPACPVARQCGGCQIQQMSYEAQLRFKEKLVDDNLKRIGKIEGYEFFPAIGMEEPFRYSTVSGWNCQRWKHCDGLLCRKNSFYYLMYRLQDWCCREPVYSCCDKELDGVQRCCTI